MIKKTTFFSNVFHFETSDLMNRITVMVNLYVVIDLKQQFFSNLFEINKYIRQPLKVSNIGK
jgi:hypothetical protein